MSPPSLRSLFFFFNDTATTEIYTLSLHDALPISGHARHERLRGAGCAARAGAHRPYRRHLHHRSEEHTCELQSPCNLVCRLLLEKKKKLHSPVTTPHTDTITDPTATPYIVCRCRP